MTAFRNGDEASWTSHGGEAVHEPSALRREE
jgi:hypothetical protein